MAQLAPIIQEASLLYGLPVPLIQAVIKAESNFYCWAVSPKGAMGLMQLMPGTAASLGVKDPFNPRENIHGGCRYLRLMLDYLKGSLPLALAAYNAGYQRVVSCGFQIPPIQETQGFVTEVLGRYQAAQNMETDALIKSRNLMPVAAIIPE
jgi:soluble lytic murein transglycosylase-like protein